MLMPSVKWLHRNSDYRGGMMKEYAYTFNFLLNGKKICWKRAKGANVQDAELNAAFWVMCHFPDLEFDQIVLA